ncbi:hypothetical protein EPO15_13130 [bacterium]|nr:MAG: hypothetical protein EPO15_13130 [bacterium]
MERRACARVLLWRELALLPFLACVAVGPASSEGHHDNPRKNCRIDADVALPRGTRRSVKARPSSVSWHLSGSGKTISVRDGALTRLDPATGAEIEIQAGLATDGQLEAGAGPTELYLLTAPALNAEGPGKIELTAYSTGAYGRRWSVEPFPGAALPMLAGPVASVDLVFVGVGDKVAALSPTNGRAVWSRTLTAWVGCCPAIDAGVVVLPTTHGLRALAADDGREFWVRPMDPGEFNPMRSPTVDAGRVYFAFDERSISALDLRSGQVLWTSPALPSPVDHRHPLIVDPSGVLVPLHGGLARVSASGVLLWSKSYEFLKMRTVKPTFLAARNAVLLGGSDGLYAASLDSGEVAWSLSGLGQVVDIEEFGKDLVVTNSGGEAFVLPP